MAQIVIVALALAAVWYVHVRIYPWKRCPRCGGAGRINRLTDRRSTWAVCPRCSGEKHVRRILAGRKDGK